MAGNRLRSLKLSYIRSNYLLFLGNSNSGATWKCSICGRDLVRKEILKHFRSCHVREYLEAEDYAKNYEGENIK
jgi:hypothetical protein